jgi:maltooligosyltrehalose trehalohydrolase
VRSSTTHRWRDSRWRGLPWHTAVFYQLHVGAFSAAGTFDAVREQLRALVRLGITAIQLMPIADLACAPDHTYGTPDDLKALIDEAHSLGLMVLLEVVHGEAPPVRDFAIANALHWLEKYRFDGLCLDAADATLTELAEAVRTRIPNRQVHLIFKNREPQAALLERSQYTGRFCLVPAKSNRARTGVARSDHDLSVDAADSDALHG